MMENNNTRLRIYKIQEGRLASYSVDMEFILIGGRYNDEVIPSIKEEMRISGCDSIDLLHIPSWDARMCHPQELELLLDELQPTNIEIPSYIPQDDNGKICKKIIIDFCENSPISEVIECSPKIVSKHTLLHRGIFLSPTKTYDEEEDNNLVKLFNLGRLSVLSTGFVKSKNVVDDIVEKHSIHNPMLLLINDMKQSPFISMDFIEKYYPLMIVDMIDNNKFYYRSGENLEEYGISSLRTEKGDIIISVSIGQNENEIETTGDERLGGGNYKKE